MTFTESNTVEAFVRDLLCDAAGEGHDAGQPYVVHGQAIGLRWDYIAPADLPRQPQEALSAREVRA